MCRLERSMQRARAMCVCLMACLSMTVQFPKTARAQCPDVGPTGCNPGGNLGAGVVVELVGALKKGYAHVNDTVTITEVSANIGSSCSSSNGMTWVVYPNNVNQVVMNDFCLAQNTTIKCPGNGSCQPYATTYKILSGDVGPKTLSITAQIPENPLPDTLSRSVAAGTVKFLAYDQAQNQGNPLPLFPSGFGEQALIIVTPKIGVTKECVYPVGQDCYLSGTPVSFAGTVVNLGDVDLGTLVVSDNHAGNLTVYDAPFGTPGRLVITSLVVGQTGYYEGQYTPSVCNATTPAEDTVTATAEDLVGPPGNPNAQVQAQASAKCKCVNPNICVTKVCKDAVAPDKPITFTAVIENCGDVDLVNVTATDTVDLRNNVPDGTVTGLVLYQDASCVTPYPIDPNTGVTLAANGGKAYVCGQISGTCGEVIQDTVQGQGFVVCLGNKKFEDQDTKTCKIPCVPSIVVIKEVVCVKADGNCADFTKSVADLSNASDNPDAPAPIPPGPNPDKDPSNEMHNAKGIKVEQTDINGNKTVVCPSFCYRLTVINNGGEDVVITEMSDLPTVSNSAFDLSNCTAISGVDPIPGVGGTLVKGQRYACLIRVDNLCDSVENTFIVNGKGDQSGITVTSKDKDITNIKTAKILCHKYVCTQFDADNNAGNSPPAADCTDNHILFVETGLPQVVHYWVYVENTGEVALDNVTAEDLLLAGKGCLTVTVNPPTGKSQFDPGDWVQQAFCDVTATVCADLVPSNVITVSAEPVPDEASDCLTYAGGKVVPAKSQCQASIDCQKAQQCRVTGGGVLIPNESNDAESCSPITTVVSGPACNTAGASVGAVKITHGGQLGAPYAQTNCGPVTAATKLTGVECIRGQWEHVRHYQGKANPKSYVEVDNFHSNTPKGIFDSLMCACLPCCENPTAGGFDGKLCNADDHKICGPEPRPAPANAIVFTGVGYLRTCEDSKGQGKGSSQAVLFRVYIEDRSEPGGAHPGGAKPPADIYSFQAWTVNGQYDSDANVALRTKLAADSCAYINGGGYQAALKLPNKDVIAGNIINDSGGLHTGNHQIHPSTGATCP